MIYTCERCKRQYVVERLSILKRNVLFPDGTRIRLEDDSKYTHRTRLWGVCGEMLCETKPQAKRKDRIALHKVTTEPICSQQIVAYDKNAIYWIPRARHEINGESTGSYR